jgi:hypothetical protein
MQMKREKRGGPQSLPMAAFAERGVTKVTPYIQPMFRVNIILYAVPS